MQVKIFPLIYFFKKIQDGDYARMNSLTTELVEKLFDDVNTSHEAFLRGVRISGQKLLVIINLYYVVIANCCLIFP